VRGILPDDARNANQLWTGDAQHKFEPRMNTSVPAATPGSNRPGLPPLNCFLRLVGGQNDHAIFRIGSRVLVRLSP